MREAVRRVFVGILVLHGLIHLLGAAKGFGWAEVPPLRGATGGAEAWAWLAACLLVLATAALLVGGVSWWWAVGLVAVLASQTMVVSSWADAQAGTAANVVLALGVGLGFAALGPTSFRAEYDAQVEAAMADATRTAGHSSSACPIRWRRTYVPPGPWASHRCSASRRAFTDASVPASRIHGCTSHRRR